MRKVILYPVLIFLLIFALDKLATIPSIRKYGRPEYTPMENILVNLKRSIEDRRAGAKPLHVLLGTSRSDRFKYMTGGRIRLGDGLSQEDQKALLGIQFETRGVIRASEFLIQYVLIRKILEATRSPDLVILEMSPEMFNKNSPFGMSNQINDNIYSLPTLQGTLDFVSGKNFKEVRNRLLFHSYAFRFKPERAVERAISGKPATSNNMAVFLLQSQKSIEELPDTYRDYHRDQIPEEVYQERFVGYTNFLKKENILMNYEFDRQEKDALFASLELLKKAKIPVVVWIPYVHPILSREWEKTDYVQFEPEILARLTKLQVPVHDASRNPPECIRFSDSSHLSSKCGPSLMADIQQTARSFYKNDVVMHDGSRDREDSREGGSSVVAKP